MEVTPHVGVWIETGLSRYLPAVYTVTPHVGVWIETPLLFRSFLPYDVTPHVGVWIETRKHMCKNEVIESHLM